MSNHSQISRWRGFLSALGISLPAGLCRINPLRIGSHRMICDKEPSIPEHLVSSLPGPEKLRMEWSLPSFINMFLPEFPHRNVPGHEHFQVLGYIAKGSFGPILKVKDKSKQKIYLDVCVYVYLYLGFAHSGTVYMILFLFIPSLVCDYCSTGDLYTYWVMIGQFGEDVVKVFAAELGSALGKHIYMTRNTFGVRHLRLADFGLSRRLERGGRAFTICGTIQYMAPEVLSGGPYNPAADWWSLGILLFALATGKFPVSPEPDHCSMLRRVRNVPYEMPKNFSPPFALLLTELLCKTPVRRLRTLERFKRQTFFHGTPFDSHLLQKTPMVLILELKNRPDRPAKARRGLTLEPFPNFDCDFLVTSPCTPTNA
uniref:Ribosomal protein S6 kinase related b n=1 Tax=Sinocyclocheilus rhinocerous TaxID=307959 RepID=A0A673IQK3_9TELE